MGATLISEIEVVCELPLQDAVTTAVWLVAIVPAVAVKLANVAPDATFTEAGTLSDALLLETATATPPELAACDKVTVHAEVPPELRLVGEHDTEPTTVAAKSEMYVVWELPFEVPVIPAVTLLEIVPAAAVKVAEAVPAAAVTDAGTDKALVLLEMLTVAPPAGAAWFSATVQVDELPLLSDVGLHESPLNAGNGAGSVIVPPAPVMEIGLPAASAPARLVRPIGVVTAELVIVTLITATTPFGIRVPFIPDSSHV